MHSILVWAVGFIFVSGANAEEYTFEVRVGERVQDWCQRLEGQRLLTCQVILDLAEDADFVDYPFLDSVQSAIPASADSTINPFLGNRFEGALTPGDYTIELTKLDSAVVLAAEAGDAATANAQQILTLLFQKSQARFGAMADRYGLNPRQQRILASIVEKEAVANTAYDTVAAVFHNRLKRNDSLGSCPTVEYALGFHRPFLLNKDLAAVATSPYNVYKKKGLPPTPICFFSDAALNAVKVPAVADSVYFFVYDWTTRRLHFEKINGYRKHQQNAGRSKENYKRQLGDIRQLFPDKFYQH
jgi:cell division protein YceG involved in septum cleavage